MHRYAIGCIDEGLPVIEVQLIDAIVLGNDEQIEIVVAVKVVNDDILTVAAGSREPLAVVDEPSAAIVDEQDVGSPLARDHQVEVAITVYIGGARVHAEAAQRCG